MTPELQELIVNEPFLRRLARRLVADEHVAEDLVQQTAMVHLERRPEGLRNARAWLSVVLRQEWLKWMQRQRRASAAKVPLEQLEGSTRPDTNLRIDEVRQLVCRELLALRDPYREVLLLRFYKGLEPQAIAEHLGRPHGTVRAQLQRGLRKLQERLDRRAGGRAGWLGALLAWSDPDRPAPGDAAPVDALPGGLSPRTLLRSSIVGVSLMMGLTWLGFQLLSPSDPVPRPASPPRIAGDQVVASSTDLPKRVPVSPRETPAATSPDESARERSEPAETREAEITVVDGKGRPLAGTTVRWLQDLSHLDSRPGWDTGVESQLLELGTTDESGKLQARFPFARLSPAQSGAVMATLFAEHPSRVDDLVYTVIWDQDELVRFEIPLSEPAVQLRVRAVNTDGLPIDRFTIGLNPLVGVPAQPEDPRIRKNVNRQLFRGGADDPVELLARLEGRYRILAYSASHGLGMAEVHCKSDVDVEVIIGPSTPIRGRVVDELGRPVTGSRISFSSIENLVVLLEEWSTAVSDADGRFELDIGTLHNVDVLAEHPDDPSRLVTRGVSLAAGDELELELVFDRSARGGLALRLVDDDGKPLGGHLVQLYRNRASGRHIVSATTDAEGRVRLPTVASNGLLIAVFSRPPVSDLPCQVFEDVVADGDERTLVVTQAHLEPGVLMGSIAPAAWDPLCGFGLGIYGMDHQLGVHHFSLPCAGEVFAYEFVPPGNYLLVLRRDPDLYLMLGTFQIRSGELVDLGELAVPPPGIVSIRLKETATKETGDAAVSRILASGWGASLPVHSRTGWIGDELSLLPGLYGLQITWRDGRIDMYPCEVRTGERTVVDVGR